jgi:anti-sigma regulatory factor (Ser/Thr protein kinase)
VTAASSRERRADALRRWLVDNGATQDQEGNILVAASEAHANAIQHAYDGDSGTVRVDNRADAASRMNALVDTVQITSSTRGTEVRLEALLGSFVAT